MRFFVLVFTLFLCSVLLAQAKKGLMIDIHAKVDEQALEFEKWYSLNEKDSFLIENFKFYLSQIELFKEGKRIYKEATSYHLIDLSDTSKSQFLINIPENQPYDEIRFLLGIDSLTNASGVKGGALDPTKGMYWTWQTGYINFKLEGKSNLCDTRNNAFTFHLGGFLGEFNAIQICRFKLKSHHLSLQFDVKQLLQQIDLKVQNHVMSPCSDAVKLATKTASIFISE